MVVERAILRAFEILRERDFPLETASENEITLALRAILENVLRKSGEIDGFNRETFEKVDRQHRAVNFNGAKIDKEPDMMFTIRNESRADTISTEDGLVVECKPVDRKHSPGQHYCDHGLQRFVDGDYAWAMQEAMMLAYVRHGRTIKQHLIPAMDAADRPRSLKTVHLPEPVAQERNSGPAANERLRRSEHKRGFPWPDGKGPASPIMIYHSWHTCD